MAATTAPRTSSSDSGGDRDNLRQDAPPSDCVDSNESKHCQCNSSAQKNIAGFCTACGKALSAHVYIEDESGTLDLFTFPGADETPLSQQVGLPIRTIVYTDPDVRVSEQNTSTFCVPVDTQTTVTSSGSSDFQKAVEYVEWLRLKRLKSAAFFVFFLLACIGAIQGVAGVVVMEYCSNKEDGRCHQPTYGNSWDIMSFTSIVWVVWMSTLALQMVLEHQSMGGGHSVMSKYLFLWTNYGVLYTWVVFLLLFHPVVDLHFFGTIALLCPAAAIIFSPLLFPGEQFTIQQSGRRRWRVHHYIHHENSPMTEWEMCMYSLFSPALAVYFAVLYKTKDTTDWASLFLDEQGHFKLVKHE